MLETRTIAIRPDIAPTLRADIDGAHAIDRISDVAILKLAHQIPSLCHDHLRHPQYPKVKQCQS